jgi:hypothetical protein
MGTNNDIRQVDAVARIYDMTEEQRWAFGQRIHDLKDSGIYGSKKNGDFNHKELCEIAEVLLGRRNEEDAFFNEEEE